jgi:2-keto-4-pentenoate hydratase/2-oxohepta-3-ene-1,7-dioic acid hydratase in catechol pathway
MKLVTFVIGTPLGAFSRVGALQREQVMDLNMAYARWLSDHGESQPRRIADAQVPSDMTAFLEGGSSAMAAARRALDHMNQLDPAAEGPSGETIVHSLDAVRLAAPVPNPASLRDFIAFEDHIAATSKKRGQPIPSEWYKSPVYYKGNHRTIIGPDEALAWPLDTAKLDYELELACVIGRQGRDIPERHAHEYIAGYTIMNDFSARDIQFQEMACRLGPSKGKDFATAIGPCLITPDEIGDVGALTMIARVNGEQWSRGRFGTIHWSFSQMIAHVSRGESIYPGDLFGSGTVGGGCGLELDRFLKPGDVVELEIQPIGILRTKITGPHSREAP